jgi:hypothetical protein
MYIPRPVHNAFVGPGRNSCETAVIQKRAYGRCRTGLWGRVPSGFLAGIGANLLQLLDKIERKFRFGKRESAGSCMFVNHDSLKQ